MKRCDVVVLGVPLTAVYEVAPPDPEAGITDQYIDDVWLEDKSGRILTELMGVLSHIDWDRIEETCIEDMNNE